MSSTRRRCNPRRRERRLQRGRGGPGQGDERVVRVGSGARARRSRRAAARGARRRRRRLVGRAAAAGAGAASAAPPRARPRPCPGSVITRLALRALDLERPVRHLGVVDLDARRALGAGACTFVYLSIRSSMSGSPLAPRPARARGARVRRPERAGAAVAFLRLERDGLGLRGAGALGLEAQLRGSSGWSRRRGPARGRSRLRGSAARAPGRRSACRRARPSPSRRCRLLPSRSPSWTYSLVRELERRISQTAIRPAADLGHEALADDPLERLREARADLALLVLGEDADDAVDRLGGVDRVQRREHEVARLRGLERDRDRLHVAHLADQDHLGRLPQGRAQGEGEGLGVGAHLALVDRGLDGAGGGTRSGPRS